MNKKVFLFFLIVLIFSISLFGEDGSNHHFDWNSLIGKVLNSTILFGGLFLWLRKPIIEFLSKQSLAIKEDIETREKILHAKNSSLEELKKRLAHIEKDIDSLKSEAVKNGKEEKGRIEALAKKEADRILANSELEINARIESSIRKLKEKIADLTINNFEKEFRKKLDDDLHKKIIKENIKIIGEIDERN